MNEFMNEWIYQWIHEWMNEWITEQMNDWVNDWTNEPMKWNIEWFTFMLQLVIFGLESLNEFHQYKSSEVAHSDDRISCSDQGGKATT